MSRMWDWIASELGAVAEFFFSDRILAYAIRWVVSISLLVGVLAQAYSLVTNVNWLRNNPLQLGEYLLVFFLAFLFSYFTAARYLKDLYEMDKFIAALWYLLYSILLFFAWPNNSASEGDLKKKKGRWKWNLIHLIGGPGKVKIAPRNLVIFEKLEGPSQVLGEGKFVINRYQWVKMVLSLDEKHVKTGPITAITLDGIKVEIPNISVRFKLREREPDWVRDSGNTSDGDSYIEAARLFATNSLVSKQESKSQEMTVMVRAIICKAARKYLNRHQIDQLIVPDDKKISSRRAMKKVLEGPEVRNQMKNIGARLLGLEFDSLQYEDIDVKDTRLAKWRETKRGERLVMEAKSEAFELSRQDAVRSRTQVEMTRRIMDALEDLNIEDERDLETLIQLRTAQILDAWSGLYTQKEYPDDKKDKSDDDGKKNGDKSEKNGQQGGEK